MKKESLIFLVPSLQGGGAEKVAVELLPYLAEKFQVTLVLLQDRCVYEVAQQIPKISFSPPLSNNVAHIIRIPYHVASLALLIRKTGARVVLSFMEQANIINVLSSFLTHHKAVISQRIMPQLQYRGKGCLGLTIFLVSKFIYPRASHIITVSNGITDYLLTHYKINKKNISFIPNAVNISILQKQAKLYLPFPIKKPYILHVGRFSLQHKAQDMVLEAFSRLKAQYESLNLVFVGDGPDREKIISLAQSLNISNNIYLTGWQDNVATFMANAEVLLFPSRREGWPNVLVEAMACGCPVVAADCLSGPKEILGDNSYGLLVPVNDVNALYNAVNILLKDQNLAAHFRRQGHERALKFAIEKISLEYARIITKDS